MCTSYQLEFFFAPTSALTKKTMDYLELLYHEDQTIYWNECYNILLEDPAKYILHHRKIYIVIKWIFTYS